MTTRQPSTHGTRLVRLALLIACVAINAAILHAVLP